MHICIMVHPASPLGVLDAGWTAAAPAPSAAATFAAVPAPPAAASPLGVLDAAWAAPVLPAVGSPVPLGVLLR